VFGYVQPSPFYGVSADHGYLSERLIDRFPGTRKKPANSTFVCFLLLFASLEMFVEAST